jgi:hypothetical protein
MAIEDIAKFEDIEILQNYEKKNLTGGRGSNDFGVVKTIKGRINQRLSNPSYNMGRRGEVSEYIGYFEYSEDNLAKIKIKGIRFKDTSGNIYKKINNGKNTMAKNNHIKIELEYLDYIQE